MLNSLSITSRDDIKESNNFISIAETPDTLTLYAAEGLFAEYTKNLKLLRTVQTENRYGNIAYSLCEDCYYATLADSDRQVVRLNRNFEELGRFLLSPSPESAVTGIGVNQRNENLLVGTFTALYEYERNGVIISRFFSFGDNVLNYACTTSGNTAVCAVGSSSGGSQRLISVNFRGEETGNLSLPVEVFVRAITSNPECPNVLRLLASVAGSRNTIITLSNQNNGERRTRRGLFGR